jgi:hypothetical protein
MSDLPAPSKATAIEGGSLGAGGGTLLALIANAMPEGVAKTTAVLLAPTFSLGLTALWMFIRAEIAQNLQKRNERREAEDKSRLFQEAEATLRSTLEAPEISEEYKKELAAEIERLHRIRVSGLMDRVTSIGAAAEVQPRAASSRRKAR